MRAVTMEVLLVAEMESIKVGMMVERKAD